MSLQECPQSRGTNQFNSTNWTNERVELLKTLWEKGLSATLICREIGGVTRNSVIGKVHRLKLPQRQSSTKAIAPPRVKRSRDHGTGALFRLDARLFGKPVVQPKEKISAAPFLSIPFMELEPNQCHYPRGEEAPFLFCGQPVKEDSSYCAYCHDLTHVVRA